MKTIKQVMMHKLYKIYPVFLVLLICHVTHAQEVKITKTIDKTFKVSDRLNLEITNKYGNVIIDTWTKNEVSLKIEILSYGKDRDAADKLTDRVEFDFVHSDDFLRVESVFDRKKSFFKDLLNAVGDYSASLLSNHKLQINYELTIPANTISVTVDNRFGDIHLGEIEGRINIALAHGNLRANKMSDFSNVELNYGNAKIEQVTDARFTLKGAELNLETAQKLDLESNSSTVTIGKISMLDIKSTNDKIYINEVRDISGSASFTNISISYLSEICRLNQNYGAVTISNIPSAFSSVRLDGKSTDYDLSFAQDANFEARINARDDKLSIGDFPGKREKRFLDDKYKFVLLSGNFGTKKSDQNVNIDAQNGEVKIRFITVTSTNQQKITD